MKIKCTILLVLALIYVSGVKAQITNIDSAAVAKKLAQILTVCKYVDFSDPNTTKLGTFYNVAQFIVYRGEDKSRAWKDVANYNNPDEKEGVDEVCTRINNTINQDPDYKITDFFTETESEGTWYVLKVSYIKKGTERKSAFAFLKLNGRFVLGDIDDIN